MGDFRTIWKPCAARHGNRDQRPQHAYPPQLQEAGVWKLPGRMTVNLLDENEDHANESGHSWTWQRKPGGSPMWKMLRW